MRRNKKHLQQVHYDKSPCTQDPLKEILGPYGTSNITKLLEGRYPIDKLDISPHARQWLKWLKQTEKERKTNPVPPTITPDMFKDLFKSTDEMTSSSPSGYTMHQWCRYLFSTPSPIPDGQRKLMLCLKNGRSKEGTPNKN